MPGIRHRRGVGATTPAGVGIGVEVGLGVGVGVGVAEADVDAAEGEADVVASSEPVSRLQPKRVAQTSTMTPPTATRRRRT